MKGNKPETCRELLDWSYANLAAYQLALQQDPPAYTKQCWMVRARLFKGLQSGSMIRQSIYLDERIKLSHMDQCACCGVRGVPLTLDHLFPKMRKGSDSGDNLVYCCQSCNSSKGKKDYFSWVKEKGERINPEIAQRYLKNAYRICEKLGLLNYSIEDCINSDFELPFNLMTLPTKYEL